MMKYLPLPVFLLLLLLSPSLSAQFRTNGTAISQANNCFRLTTNLGNQAGSVWYLNQVNISQSFDLYFDVYLGCSNGGADGMAFVLQPISTNVGSSGGALGYGGINPSLAVEMDTYQNSNFGDPAFDHIAVTTNGSVSHTAATNLAGPVTAKANNANIEDCNFHSLRITWDAPDTTLRVYFDCSLRITYQGDIVQNVFNNNPNVYWGFTAATGALTNVHSFCLNYISFTQSLSDTTICQGDSVQLNVGTGASYVWTPAAGLSDSSIANPRAFPDTTTTYRVAVTDGCMNTRWDSVTITVHDSTDLIFDLGPVDTLLCTGDSLPLDFSGRQVSYLWQNASTLPSQTLNAPGQYWLQLNNVCGQSADTLDLAYEVYPQVDLGRDTVVCDSPLLRLDVTFNSLTNPGTQYLWKNGQTGPAFSASQDDTLWVQLSNYCGTATDSLWVRFQDTPQPVNLGPDTILCQGDTIRLDASQPGVNYRWTTGSNQAILPVLTAGSYQVSAFNACGIEMDRINITGLQAPHLNLGPDTVLCLGDSLILAPSLPILTNLLWQNSLPQPQYVVKAYDRQVTAFAANACGVAFDTLRVSYDSIPIPDLGADTALCPGETLVLDASVINANSYQWQGGPATPTWAVSDSGLYVGVASNQCGSGQDSMVITILAAPAVNLGPDTLLCDRSSLPIDISRADLSYQWNDGLSLPTRSLQDSGLYWVVVSNRCGEARDSIQIRELRAPVPPNLGNDTTACTGQVLSLNVAQPNVSYLWSDGSSGSSLSLSEEGTYWVELSNACGVERDSVQFWFDEMPMPDLGPDSALCAGEVLVFNVFQERARYLWSDNSRQATLLARQPGLYWVDVINSCGTVRDEVNLIFDTPPPPLDLGADQTLCQGDSLILDARLPATPTAPLSYRWLDDSQDSIRFVTSSGLYRVEVLNRCGKSIDGVQIAFEVPLEPDLGPDTFRCESERLRIDAQIDDINFYRWSTGSNEPFIFAESEGLYWVEVENSCGPVRDSVLLTDTDCNCTVFIPSAFSPNQDGKNETFGAIFECEILDFQLKVFNRWGRLVAQFDDPSQSWDGTLQGQAVPEGVYVWVLRYQSRQQKREAQSTETGTVTLIR
jgi:gliding motility-associated-like protein